MDDRSLGELLERFGLSEKEIDTYLALLEHGEAKASTIADAAGVSKRYVYSISEELERRGFVSVNDHVVPTTIRANPPDEVVGRLSRDVESMRPALESRYSRTEPEADQFEVVKSRVTVHKRVRELIDDAEAEIALSLTPGGVEEMREKLRAAVERGVLVILIVADEEDPTGLPLEQVASVARVWSQPMPTLVTADQRRGLVAPTELMTRANSDKQGIVLTQDQLAPVIVGSFLGNYWPMAAERYRTDPAPLPRTYESFRHAVFDATLLLRDEVDLIAEVEGRRQMPDDENGTGRSLNGRVLNVRQGLLEPTNNSFPVENALIIETDEGTFSIGGEGAFIEDIEARSVTLRRE